jgi:hypothetical protein
MGYSPDVLPFSWPVIFSASELTGLDRRAARKLISARLQDVGDRALAYWEALGKEKDDAAK